MGVVHCMNVGEKLDSFDGLLEKYATSCELVNRPQNLLARIDKSLQRLEIKSKKSVKTKTYPHEKTIDETLSKAEHELSEIETKINPIIEELDSYSKIIKRIELLLTSWKVNRKKYPVVGTPFLNESKGEILSEVDQKFVEIETRFKEIDNISVYGSKILVRINKLAKKLSIKSTDFTTNGINYSVDEKFLDFLEQTLIPIEEASQSKLPNIPTLNN
jgi:DNA repair ATPase RecN